jgi:hypothetical protein
MEIGTSETNLLSVGLGGETILITNTVSRVWLAYQMTVEITWEPSLKKICHALLS